MSSTSKSYVILSFMLACTGLAVGCGSDSVGAGSAAEDVLSLDGGDGAAGPDAVFQPSDVSGLDTSPGDGVSGDAGGGDVPADIGGDGDDLVPETVDVGDDGADTRPEMTAPDMVAPDTAGPDMVPSSEIRCGDGADDDGDGDVDCDDADCADAAQCQPESACGDGADNDGDGAVDCEDSDCSSRDVCMMTPRINMDNLVVQSQVEPFRGDQSQLPGDFAVIQVQMALDAEGIATDADGWYGNQTAANYGKWQERLGYSGIGANGIPGPSSLDELSMDRFEVQRYVRVGGRSSVGGSTVNKRTKDMLDEAERLLGFDIVLTQGSYNAGGVAQSAGTHDGGGAVDVSVRNLTTQQRWRTVQAMRRVGFAAWLRTPSQGNWPYHIHAIAVGDTDMSTGARNQVADYYVGRNGLASHAADNTPGQYQVPFTWWEKYQREN